MTKFILAAGVAALAISVPAASKPGGNGGGHGHGNAGQQHGGAHGKAHVSAQAHANGHGAGGRAQVAARIQAKPHGHAQNNRQQAKNHQQAVQRNKQTQQAQERRHARDVRQAQARNHDKQVRQAQVRQMERNRDLRRQGIRDVRQARNERIRDIREMRNRQDLRANYAGNVGYGVGGCPPGLAKKAVACMPPGQARKLVGARVAEARQFAAFNELPKRLRNVYQDTPNYYYRYGDGYVYRVNRTNDVISSLLPLFGAGYGIGQAFPQTYSNYGLPAAYQPFYPTSPGYDYRYANGYVYQVDPYTGMIQNVDPMLGYGYGYGQMMPAAYSTYNVPYQYRPMYYDTSDAYYRYAPGAIYQVDPQTSLITGIAALLTNGMTVGQPMPVGYNAYNVPYDYRAQYYDTPDNWYRYANGNIYRVDPATQLVTALVTSILT